MKRLITPTDIGWSTFVDILENAVENNPCAGSKILARSTLEWMDNQTGDIDVNGSLDYFENHGGYCDCEVLANVERRWASEQIIQ